MQQLVENLNMELIGKMYNAIYLYSKLDYIHSYIIGYKLNKE